MDADTQKSLNEAFQEMKKAFIEIWEGIRDISDRISEAIEVLDHKKEIRNQWHLPINLMKDSQVMLKAPRDIKIRSNI